MTLTGDAALRELAAWAVDLGRRDPPPAVARRVEQLVLLGIAWCALGARADESPALRRVSRALNGAGEGTVIGCGERHGWAEAAFLNAAHAQIYDCNDGYPVRGAWHPGRVLIPTALVMAECVGASGQTLLRALVAGYEVAARAWVSQPRTRSDGLGAAAAAGVLLGLPADVLAHALLLSDQHGPRLYPGPGNFNAAANHVSNGQIARVAVESAFLAQAGIDAHHDTETLTCDTDWPERDDPATYAVLDTYIKPYIACRLCHGPIEMAQVVRAEHKGDLDAIARIDIRINGNAPFMAQRVPPNANTKTAFFSVPYSVACTLCDGAVDTAQYRPERLAAPDVQAWQERIVVDVRPEGDANQRFGRYTSHMRVTFFDGHVEAFACDMPRGDARRPLSDDEVVALFREWAGPAFDRDSQTAIVAQVFDLAGLRDIRALTVRLVSS